MNRSRIAVAFILVGFLAFGAANLAVAGKKAKVQDLYVDLCKPCHAEDSEHGEYTPMSLIQDQWERFFDEKYVETHKGVVFEAHEGKKVTDVISEETIEKIKKFAIDHAADSEHPMTCG